MTLIDTMAGNLGTSVDLILIFFTLVSSFVFFAEDLRIGLIALLLLLAADFFTLAFFGYSHVRALLAVLTVFVFMTIQLWLTRRTGGGVVY